jgi:hypothetical protein
VFLSRSTAPEMVDGFTLLCANAGFSIAATRSDKKDGNRDKKRLPCKNHSRLR